MAEMTIDKTPEIDMESKHYLNNVLTASAIK